MMKRIISSIFVSIIALRVLAVGYTPTTGGLVVNLHKGDKILVSVMVDHDNNSATPDREYFLENYTRYTGDDYFKYDGGYFLKLVQQEAGATKPAETSVWTVDSALTRVIGKDDYSLGGISYTLWNDNRTFKTLSLDEKKESRFQFYGALSNNSNDKDLCDAVFVIPTNYENVTSFDPNKTLTSAYKRTDQDAKGRFNGQTGTGFAGMSYREVYMMIIPRSNTPNSYTNAAVVTFNTTKSNKSWSAGTIPSGRAAYAYADDKHKPTTRTVFRLYILNEPIHSCGGYFFAYDEQNTLKYREGPNTSPKKDWTDSTALQKIFTMDRLFCMDQVDETTVYRTRGLRVPAPDSSYYYVGKNNRYYTEGVPAEYQLNPDNAAVYSMFTKIREMRLRNMPDKMAPAGAHGRMVVNTSSEEENLGVQFEPTGYFLKIGTGKNIPLVHIHDDEWVTQDMWTIDAGWEELTIKTMLMTGPEFREDDPGADVEGWSVPVKGKEVPVSTGGYVTSGMQGYAVIFADSTQTNGKMTFIPANTSRHVDYDNNGFLGVDIPDQYPMDGYNSVKVEHPRLNMGYTFDGWNTAADGKGTTYLPGAIIDLPAGKTTLYAQARFIGEYNIAISFMQDGKRYFLQHPGAAAPRYARTRTFGDWTNVWQGMGNADNIDPEYINTFTIRKDPPIRYGGPLAAGEKVLDPMHHVVHGYEDSLVFYEHFTPALDEYLGLYYQDPNTILANNSWSGLFIAEDEEDNIAWPDIKTPAVDGVTLKSTHYVEAEVLGDESTLDRKERSNSDKPYVKYNATDNQFDGVTEAQEPTLFQLSAVAVADAHYVVLPDTMVPWRDTIEFGYHQDEQREETVISRLIGKQLMARMIMTDDTVYFHPNRDKIFTTASELRLSSDFRLTQDFEFIRDSRVSAPLHEGDSVIMEGTEDYGVNTIVSGNSSPFDVTDGSGNHIDIVDTVRIRLTQGGISRIKEYYGRWKKRSADDGLTVKGSTRYRDVIIRTKTYHEGAEKTRLLLEPEYETYSFSPLAGIEKQINFTLVRERSRSLMDKDNNPVSTVVVARDTIRNKLALTSGACTLKGSHFEKGTIATNYVRLSTALENTEGVNYDTLTVNTTINDTVVTVKVPLLQAALTSHELLWSVMDGSKRYFILAKKVGESCDFVFRQYRVNNSIMYKENSSTHLIKGSKDAANSDSRYITPWIYTYSPEDSKQLTLKAILTASDTVHINVSGSPCVSANDSVALTYKLINTYTNDNANYEEQVKIKYGDTQWLKFTGGATPSLSLTTDENQASVFSWSYLVQEYSLLNNGTYPSRASVEFGYNEKISLPIETKYKAYKEYSTLFNNTITYLCRQEETSPANLRSDAKEWLTDMTFSLIRDSRFEPAASHLDTLIDRGTLTTNVSTSVFSPLGTVNIVDTLDVRLSLKSGAPAYRFKGDWSTFTSVDDAHLKIPLIRKAYHTEDFDSLYATVEDDQFSYSFPATITKGTNDSCVFTLFTFNRTGQHMLDADGNPVRSSGTTVDVTDAMDFTDKNRAEIRLSDEFGKIPDWCTIRRKTKNSIVIECTKNGIRSPRHAYVYIAYLVMVDPDGAGPKGTIMRFVNYRLTVTQVSSFTYANNQVLIHSNGASGDEKMENGMQQVHENRRVLYYYPDQDVELPVRERAFYGWWRWYREGNDVNGKDVSDTDVPDSLWRVAPTNTGRYVFPYRSIGDSVMLKKTDGTDSVKVLVTMGRYTVFHYKSKDYGNKLDPPAKTPRVVPPTTAYGGVKPVLTYAVDISNYYDNLPMSVSQKNQVDVALLDTILEINEPTLSLREVFELRPWTEMADRMDSYKSTRTANDAGEYPLAGEHYMEDHVMMAPIGNRMLLQTEQRYNYENLKSKGRSESLLGYYMHDDNWDTINSLVRKDTMIYCGGWDADCEWYTYDQNTKKYSKCEHSITPDDDFLQVPAKSSISAGHEFDTVYYCLRARSWATTYEDDGEGKMVEVNDSGAYMFNICRYKIIYHNPSQYGPLQETKTKEGMKALITKEEIEHRYDVLERLDFDYVKPGPAYHVYPHPLPWGDASYGYTYPETANLPHNRYHDESDFPNHGEYGLINRIPYSSYWRKMEQHGGAANGYMIYCDGMASAGQVAALTLETNLCAGQKMFFSGYVGNPSSQKNKSNPNFIFSVQGMTDAPGAQWEDITSYMTGDIQPSDNWYQIYFPILHTKSGENEYTHFRVRIYNVAADFDGNDFVIDDMCIFATKPPLIAYQAQTTCNDYGKSEADAHVLLRLDYQGITGEGYNGHDVCYTVRQNRTGGESSYVKMTDGYLNEEIHEGATESIPDTIFGKIYIPKKDFEPQDEDSIYRNMNELLARFDTTFNKPGEVREGYIYEILEGDIRPVKYVVHKGPMSSKYDYVVHMNLEYKQLLNSMCAMTSHLKISNRMVLELNGEEQPETEQLGLCANSTYDIGLRVKGSMYQDSVAPVDVEGSCVNDWLLYGDTAEASSLRRYGYKYKDIKTVITEILRAESTPIIENGNQFAKSFSEIDRTVLEDVQTRRGIVEGKDISVGVVPYDLLDSLVSKGFLQLYKSKMTASVMTGDSLQYIIFPIVGTGSEEVTAAQVEVCPNPIFIKLKPDKGGAAPLMIGGLNRDSTERTLPINVLASEMTGNSLIKLRVDSIMPNVGIFSIELRSTDDPDYREGIHSLKLVPDKKYPSEGYYAKGDSISLTPAATNNYTMKAGYNYTFDIVMQTMLGQLTMESGCEVGVVPFTMSIVPNYVRWDPQPTGNNNWNDATNWIGINANNEPIHEDAHFVPMENTFVVIPAMEDGKPYPVVQPLPSVRKDSVQKVGFQYNQCNTIRFLSGAALGQQQYINNTDVVIDMNLPNRKWAFRTAPVKGMISGDLYMADADNNGTTPMWEVGEFDASGRSYKTGNASFWLSVYNAANTLVNPSGEDSTRTVTADWSKVTNAMNLPLPAGKGFAVYARTASGSSAVVRLPKTDDTYYYYGTYGEKINDKYVPYLQAMRNDLAGGLAGKMAFRPTADHDSITLSNEVASNSFVFGNYTMGYLDIWGFISDNPGLVAEIGYMNERSAASLYTTVTKVAAEASGEDEITNTNRYLPPMHVMVLTKTGEAATELKLRLNTSRVVTDPSQVVARTPSPAPRRIASPRSKGIMRVTAKNAASERCTSHLLLGQGYHEEVIEGEDAVLTTINIDNYTANLTPTTPFNLYSVADGNGMCIDLRDSIVNVPVSFYMSDLEFEEKTQLWFTGVNNIDGPLVLYDAWADSERKIIDGICLTIETPVQNHQKRYFIRRPGYRPQDPNTPIATRLAGVATEDDQAIKIIRDDQVLIIRNGHVYTMLGQEVR